MTPRSLFHSLLVVCLDDRPFVGPASNRCRRLIDAWRSRLCPVVFVQRTRRPLHPSLCCSGDLVFDLAEANPWCDPRFRMVLADQGVGAVTIAGMSPGEIALAVVVGGAVFNHPTCVVCDAIIDWRVKGLTDTQAEQALRAILSSFSWLTTTAELVGQGV